MDQCDLDVSQLKGATLLVGSMISADRETGMASGSAISIELIRRLCAGALPNAPASFGLTALAQERVEKISQDTPFEVILQHYPYEDYLRKTLAEECEAGCQNRYHRAISTACRKGYISNVITTNYDRHIEAADPKWQVVLDEDKARSATALSPNGPLLFKIHGCAGRPCTMVYQLAQEGMLPEWKQDFLLDLVDGKDVVVVGYSGRDFDVCPILFRANYRKLIWLFAGDNPLQEARMASQNIKLVHSSPQEFSKIYAAGGGFDVFFQSTLDTGSAKFEPSASAPKLVDKLFAKEATHPEAFSIWRARFFQSIACPIGLHSALQTLPPQLRTSTDALELQSALLERLGRYKQSNAAVQQWRNTIDAASKPNLWLDTFYVEAGRWYSSGNIPRFIISKYKFEREVRRLEANRISSNKEVAFAQHIYLQILMLKIINRIPLINIAMRKIAIRRHLSAIVEAGRIRYTRGEWQDLHLIRVAANDMKIKFQIGGHKHSNYYIILDGVEAFSQLNNVVGRASTARRHKLSYRSSCDDILDELVYIGHYGELWKFFSAFIENISHRHFVTYKYLCKYSLSQCEYYFIIKILLLAKLHLRILRYSVKRRGDIIKI